MHVAGNRIINQLIYAFQFRSLHFILFYTSWQANLLHREIKSKKKTATTLTSENTATKDDISQNITKPNLI